MADDNAPQWPGDIAHRIHAEGSERADNRVGGRKEQLAKNERRSRPVHKEIVPFDHCAEGARNHDLSRGYRFSEFLCCLRRRPWRVTHAVFRISICVGRKFVMHVPDEVQRVACACSRFRHVRRAALPAPGPAIIRSLPERSRFCSASPRAEGGARCCATPDTGAVFAPNLGLRPPIPERSWIPLNESDAEGASRNKAHLRN